MANTNQQQKKLRRLSPAQTITVGFAAMVLAGTALLMLPVASATPGSVGFLNALFTATSAVCVTGLVVVNTAAGWAAFGKIVILLLIQLGALGFMTTLTLAMLAIRRRISLRDRLIIQASFNQNDIGGMVKLVRAVLRITLVCEGAGAALLTLAFWLGHGQGLPRAAANGVFHAVSAFCNAGFDILGENSLTEYRSDPLIMAVIMALIVLGGLGFVVVQECVAGLRGPRRPRFRRLSLHTKLALCVTGVLLASGTLLFLALEWDNPATLGPMGVGGKLGAALFQSVTLRTAGFNTIVQGDMGQASQFFACLFMLAGGSPAGTAGGIKTVTLGVIVVSVVSVLRGRSRLEAFGRSLPLDMLQKALAVVATMAGVVLAASLVLLFTERGAGYPHSYIDLLFETSSAAATVGISTGITGSLSAAGRLVITLCMFLGRLSPVTVVVALSAKLHAEDLCTAYPEERVIVG